MILHNISYVQLNRQTPHPKVRDRMYHRGLQFLVNWVTGVWRSLSPRIGYEPRVLHCRYLGMRSLGRSEHQGTDFPKVGQVVTGVAQLSGDFFRSFAAIPP